MKKSLLALALISLLPTMASAIDLSEDGTLKFHRSISRSASSLGAWAESALYSLANKMPHTGQ